MTGQVASKWSFRKLPPAGGFASPAELFSAYRLLIEKTESSLLKTLQQQWHVSGIRFTHSGKEALELLFKALPPRIPIAFGAYNCPDIFTAALAAKRPIILMDQNPDDGTLRFGSMPTEESCIVLTNLYGFFDPEVSHFRAHWIVDDLCQAFGGIREDGEISGAAKVISLGRGKAICGVGGGAALWNTDSKWQESLSTEVRVDSSAVRIFKESIESCVIYVLSTPLLYSLFTKLPGLGLGETKIQLEYKTRALGIIQLCHAVAAFEAQYHRQAIIERVSWWTQALAAYSSEIVFWRQHSLMQDKVGAAVPTRLPILVPAGIRGKLLKSLENFGATGSYPCVLDDYPELRGKAQFTDITGARSIASRIVTLPVHNAVTQADIERAAIILREIFDR